MPGVKVTVGNIDELIDGLVTGLDPSFSQVIPVSGTTKQVSVATTATLIAAANPQRRAIKITNVTGTQLIYIGFSGAVSATTGDYLAAAAGSNTTTYAQDAIWGIAITGAQTVTVMEEVYS